MVTISYKDFMAEVRLRLDDFSKEDLQNLILQWASKEQPSHREDFLYKLTLKDGETVTAINRDEHLIAQIDAFAERVEDEEYVDGFGWDPVLREEREFGDESWAEEMDDLFLDTRDLLMQGDYAVAEEAYRKLFDILEMGEEGLLPGDDFITPILDVDVSEHNALFLRSVYMNIEADERVRVLYDFMMDYGYVGLTKIKLKDVRDSLDAPLPDFDAFLTDWIAFLKGKTPSSDVSELLREAVFLKGGIPAISEFATAYAESFPKAYVDWLEALEMEGDNTSILQAATEGLSNIPSHYRIRAEVAEKLTEAGEKRGDNKLKLKGLRESFYSNPLMKYLLDLYLTAEKEGRFDEVRDEVEKRMLELKNEERSDFTFEDLERVTSPFRERVFTHAQLLGNHYEDVFHKCKGEGSLGWSFGSNSKPIMLLFLLDVLSKDQKHSKILLEQWKSVITQGLDGGDKMDTEKYMKNMIRVKASLHLTAEEEDFYLEWCKKEIGHRVDAIVSNKKRGSYDKAARILVAMAETLANREQVQKAHHLISRYREKYPRHRAFKTELTEALQGSGL